MIRFSVVISLYNKEAYITRAINSVLAQTVKDFELIIVNDGSTDQSAAIVERIQDHRIRLIHQENAGECAARNTGIQESKAPFIAFLDADDAWMPDFLRTISLLIQEYPKAGAYATRYFRIKNDKKKPSKIKNIPSKDWEGLLPSYFLSASWGGDNPISSSAVCVPKDVFENVGGPFTEGIKLRGDLEMWTRIALKYPICFSTKIMSIYYLETENSACATYIPDVNEVPYTKSILNAISKDQLDQATQKYAFEFIAKYTYFNALSLLKFNHRVEARKLAQQIRTTMMPLLLRKHFVILSSHLPHSFIKFIISIFEKIKLIILYK